MLKAVHVKKCLRDYIFVPHSYDLSCMKLRESLGVLKSLKIILKKKFYFSYWGGKLLIIFTQMIFIFEHKNFVKTNLHTP